MSADVRIWSCNVMQVDELNRAVTQIIQDVEKIKRNHNVILASVQNNEAKDETNDLMAQIKKLSHRVHGGLKSESFSWQPNKLTFI